jgi:alpha-L-fucosidase
LDAHPLPEWFDDAKFGMFVDWGLYSIAGWAPRKEKGAMYPDWYLYDMYHRETREYHCKTWGEGFERDDFIPRFTASEYNPEALVALAKEAGMKYIVPFCKHHDGFCLWDSSLTWRDAADMGPKRDLVRPLVEACARAGLKFGFYFSVDEWEYPLVGAGGERLMRLWAPVKVAPYDESYLRGKIAGKAPVRDFVGDYILPQAREFIDKYDPDILWLDGEWDLAADERRTRDLAAYFYNHAEGRKAVLVNDRLGAGTRGTHGDFFTSEYHDGHASPTHKWEENRSIGQSYGYNREDSDANVLSVEALLDLLVDTVSQGGNLLLMVNLTGPGAAPEMYATRLKAIGAWLKVNGEAIYGTRRYAAPGEGDIRFTRSKDGRCVYAISLKWPRSGLRLTSVHAAEGSAIRLLGSAESLPWREQDGALLIEIPDAVAAKKPCDHAYAFRIETIHP